MTSRKDALENEVSANMKEVKKTSISNLKSVEEEIRRSFLHQKAENSRLQKQISVVASEKTTVQQLMVALKRRVTELESELGEDQEIME